MYAAETWTLNTRDMNRLRAFETKCLRRFFERKVATENQEYHEKNRHNLHKHQYRPENYREEIELLRSQQAPKASCFWHAIMDGKNERGRPKRRWTDEWDDLVHWCKDICTLHGLAMDRIKWSHFMKYVMNTN